MFKQLIFAVLVLLFLGRLEGKGMENPALLPTLNLISMEDTIPPVRVVSLRNDRNDLYQLVIPRHLSKEWNTSGTIIDHHTAGPANLNIFEMIQGRVPGVWVTGSYFNYKVRIRGASGPPLFILDGMPFNGYDDRSLNDLLESIPPADVDYIEVLKGVAESAIYGPGAGNGVIIVHTKKGEL